MRLARFLVLLGLLFALAPSAAPAQSITTQCIANASASGTANAITIPPLACASTTNLLLLTTQYQNTANVTLQQIGGPIVPIHRPDGTALAAGDLIGPNFIALLTSTGNGWTLLNPGGGSGGFGGGGQLVQTDQLTVTAMDTLSTLSQTYVPGFIELVVNSTVYTSSGSNPAFTVSGQTISWSPVNAGFDLQTTDTVYAIYTYTSPSAPSLVVGVTKITGGITGNCLVVAGNVLGIAGCGGGGGGAGGANGSIQYNNSGAFGGIAPGLNVFNALQTTTNTIGGFTTQGGAIVTNDCLKWGPGIVDAGSCGGGAYAYVTCQNNSGDAALIQNAINSVASAGGTVLIYAPPSKPCDLTTGFSEVYSNVTVRGYGAGQTVLAVNFASGDVITVGSASGALYGTQFCNLIGFTIQPATGVTRTGGWGIHKNATNRCSFNDIDIENMYQGILLGGIYGGSGNADYNTTFTNSFVENNSLVGIQVGETSSLVGKWLSVNVYMENVDASLNGTGLLEYDCGGCITRYVQGINNGTGESIVPASGQYVIKYSNNDQWDSSTRPRRVRSPRFRLRFCRMNRPGFTNLHRQPRRSPRQPAIT